MPNFAVPTIRIKSGGATGCVVINAEDFDPEIHVKFSSVDEPAGAGALTDDEAHHGGGLVRDSKSDVVASFRPGFDLAEVVSDRQAEALVAAGFGGAPEIYAATVEELRGVEGIGPKLAERIRGEAARFVDGAES